MIVHIIVDILSVLLFLYMMLTSVSITENNSDTVSGVPKDVWVTDAPGRKISGYSRLFLSIDDEVFLFQTRHFSRDELENIGNELLSSQETVSLVIPKYQEIPFLLAGWTDIASISCGSDTIYSIDLYNSIQKENRVTLLIVFPVLWTVLFLIQYWEILLKWLFKRGRKGKKKSR